ncbi:MAG TPA: sigma-70 family RNA polymerase sigma factor [Bryobacterales bacterium]|nr:sigma-70 family RNA polymerase sigma factor [Bryobacterales bacterium]
MALPNLDRQLLQRCLARKPGAWERFVDRFLGLVLHVVQHTAHARSIRLSKEDTDDLVADVFLTIIDDDFALLRRFRGESSLATYLTVIARRIVVRELLKRQPSVPLGRVAPPAEPRGQAAEKRIEDREEIERLLSHLKGLEADVVRMYHLEGRSYREISSRTGIPENSIGPTLSRARQKLRQVARD